MKKLIYSLAIILVGLSSCAKFDDPKTENYGVGPEVAVTMTAAMPTDSAFTIQITPAAGATYYAYAISTAPAAVDSATLIKGGYGNTVLNVSDQPSLTINIKTAEPNTTYYVYASACNDKGIVGKVASASIKTSDSGAPIPTAAQADAANKAYLVQFNQNIIQGEGKVTAVYYKEFDFGTPVPVENVDVKISGKVAQFTATDAPAGAYVLFSWEAGAFVDATGNRCAPFTSKVNPEGTTIATIFQGLWIQVPHTTWAITDSQFTAPKAGSVFPKWDEFEGVIEFAEKVYVVEDDVKDGDFVVTYTNNSRTASYKLPKAKINFGVAEDFSTQKVTFALPAATQPDDQVTVSIAEGVFKDVLGNGNAAYASDKVYWISFAMTPEMAVGTFNCGITYKDEAIDLGNFSIELAPTAENPNGLLIKNFYLADSQLDGYYDLDAGKIYFEDGQLVGMYTNSKGTKYGLVFYNAENETDDAVPVPFTVKADGTMVADVVWGIYAYNEDFSSGLGWFEIAHTTQFTPVKAAAAKRAAKKSAKTIRVKSKLNKKFSK